MRHPRCAAGAVAVLFTLVGCAAPTMTVPAASTTARVSPSPSEGAVLAGLAGLTFVRKVDGVSQLFLVDENGALQQLTFDPAEMDGIVLPAWSPHGSHLVYARGAPPLWTVVVNADGTEPRQLGAPGIFVDWAPDGRSVLIGEFNDVTTPDWAPRHWLVDIATGEAEDIALPPVHRWLADGTYLGRRLDRETGSAWAFRFDPGTGEETLLLEADYVVPSPDGQRLAFHRHRSCPPTACLELGIAEADGTKEATLAAGSGAAWSPDATMIAYTELIGGGPNSRLALMNVEGERIGVPELAVNDMVWTRDGLGIVVSTGDHLVGDWRLVLLNLADGALTDLGEGSWPVMRPAP